MNIGDTVKVYEDPITCQRLEGTAELIEPGAPRNTPHEYDKREYWTVAFPEDDGAQYQRWINIDHH